jgi:hypothetical protein
MRNDARRITLITRPPSRNPDSYWNMAPDAASRIIVVGSFTVLRYALDGSLSGVAQDVDRLIIDRTATPAQYLELLASLPEEFSGDVLYIRDDGAAFLSATGRGAGRMIYDLSPNDVHFYLQTHDLSAAPMPLRKTA